MSEGRATQEQLPRGAVDGPTEAIEIRGSPTRLFMCRGEERGESFLWLLSCRDKKVTRVRATDRDVGR